MQLDFDRKHSVRIEDAVQTVVADKKVAGCMLVADHRSVAGHTHLADHTLELLIPIATEPRNPRRVQNRLVAEHHSLRVER